MVVSMPGWAMLIEVNSLHILYMYVHVHIIYTYTLYLHVHAVDLQRGFKEARCTEERRNVS